MRLFYSPIVVVATLTLSLPLFMSKAWTAPTGPVSGAYSFTGAVATATPKGGAKCPTVGQAVSGDAYVLKSRSGFEGHFLPSGSSPAWGFSLKPSGSAGSILTFGVTDQGPLNYAVVPLANRLQGKYTEHATAGADATRFALNFVAVTGPIGAGAVGSCTIGYLLNFKTGVSPRVLNFLKGVL